jgi:hypothetical protein
MVKGWAEGRAGRFAGQVTGSERGRYDRQVRARSREDVEDEREMIERRDKARFRVELVWFRREGNGKTTE